MGKLAIFLAVLVLAGCGTTTERNAKVEEVVTYALPAMVFDTPAGQIVSHPVRIKVHTARIESSTEEKKIDMPDPAPLMQAAASGASMGPLGIAGSILGLITTTAAGYLATKRKTATDNANRRVIEIERHRNQLIDSVEAAREVLPDDVDEKFVTVLGVKQDKDLQTYIQQRTT